MGHVRLRDSVRVIGTCPLPDHVAVRVCHLQNGTLHNPHDVVADPICRDDLSVRSDRRTTNSILFADVRGSKFPEVKSGIAADCVCHAIKLPNSSRLSRDHAWDSAMTLEKPFLARFDRGSMMRTQGGRRCNSVRSHALVCLCYDTLGRQMLSLSKQLRFGKVWTSSKPRLAVDDILRADGNVCERLDVAGLVLHNHWGEHGLVQRHCCGCLGLSLLRP